MSLVKRILTGVAIVVALGVVSLAVALSYDARCDVAEPLADGSQMMSAIVQRCYGSSEVLKLERIAKPQIAEDQMLVKVRASSVNPADWHSMTGKPYIMRISAGYGRPSRIHQGIDFSGTIEAVGKNVTKFKVGDDVFGARGGAFGEYIAVNQSGSVAIKPANLSFEQAAAMPVAAVTALQGLRDHGHLQPGQRVLINGASGGVGTFAVQIAKSFGAEVTGVCSTRNVELVRSIGADHVIDYTKENYTQRDERYDLILDNVGNHPLLDIRRVLKPGGTYVIVGGPKHDPWIGPLIGPIKAMLLAPFVDETMLMFIANTNQDDLNVLGELARTGKMTPVIDRRYSLSQVPEAMSYLGTQRARGKVVIDIEGAGLEQQVSEL